MEIPGKIAIVSGGASGIGRGTCEELAAKGAKVMIFDLNEDACKEAVVSLGADKSAYAIVDVSDEEAVVAGVEKTVDLFGAVHICVNCAGVPFAAKTADDKGNVFPLNTWKKVIDVNLTGTFNVLKHTASRMIKNEGIGADLERGVIVNISSAAAYEGQAGQAAYSASKAGIVGMTLPIARDLARYGIRVNSIAPGIFNTPMLKGMPEKVTEALKLIPLFPKRLGNPREIGMLVCQIVENSMFNAEVIKLDAGARMT